MPHAKLLASFIQSGNVMERMGIAIPPPQVVVAPPLMPPILPFTNPTYLAASNHSSGSPVVRATVVSRNDSGAGSCDNSDSNRIHSDGYGGGGDSSAHTTSGLARYPNGGGGMSLHHPNFTFWQQQQQQQSNSPAHPNRGHGQLDGSSSSNLNNFSHQGYHSQAPQKQPSPHSGYTYPSSLQQLTPSNTITTVGSANLRSYTTPESMAAIRAQDPDAAAWDANLSGLSIGVSNMPLINIPTPPVPAVERSMPSAITTLDAIRHPTDNSLLEAMQNLTLFWHPFFYQEPDLDESSTRKMVEARYLPLFALEPPAISIEHYLKRLIENMRCSTEAYIYALCLIHKVSRKSASRFGPASNEGGPIREAFYKDLPNTIPVTTRSIHRLLLTALVVAAKMRDDKYYSTAHYANVGGVGREDLLTMESTFLQLLGFDATVRPEHYCDMVYSIRQHCSTLMHLDGLAWAGPAWAEVIKSIAIPSLDALRREMVAQADGERTEWILDYQRKASKERSLAGPPLQQLLTVAMDVSHSNNCSGNNISMSSTSEHYPSGGGGKGHHPLAPILLNARPAPDNGAQGEGSSGTLGMKGESIGAFSPLKPSGPILPTVDVTTHFHPQGSKSNSSRPDQFAQTNSVANLQVQQTRQQLPALSRQPPGSTEAKCGSRADSGSARHVPLQNGSESEATTHYGYFSSNSFVDSASGHSTNFSCSVNHTTQSTRSVLSGSTQPVANLSESSTLKGLGEVQTQHHPHHPNFSSHSLNIPPGKQQVHRFPLQQESPQAPHFHTTTATNPTPPHTLPHLNHEAPKAGDHETAPVGTKGGFQWGVLRHPSLGP